VQDLEPIKIGDFIYYRRFDNPADNLTLYRFPVDELQSYGLSRGEVPYLKESEKGLEDLHEDELAAWQKKKDNFPEDVVFHLRDIVAFYQDFALKDERIKEFVEKLKEYIEQMTV
jgi:hypothetical protein